MEEEWKDYIVYAKNQFGAKWLRTHIQISNFGNVRGFVYKYKPFKPEMVKIKNGRRTIAGHSVYTLVDELFRGALPNGYVVHHKDFNKLNDRLDNLERLTNEEHLRLHTSNGSPFKGFHHSDKSKELLSIAHTGKKLSKRTKLKMSKQRAGRHWYNNGNNEIFCYECPDGFVKGRLSFSEEHKNKISEGTKKRYERKK